MQRVRDALVSERQALLEGLKKISFLQHYPSQANFVLCKVSNFTAPPVLPALTLATADRIWHVLHVLFFLRASDSITCMCGNLEGHAPQREGQVVCRSCQGCWQRVVGLRGKKSSWRWHHVSHPMIWRLFCVGG